MAGKMQNKDVPDLMTLSILLELRGVVTVVEKDRRQELAHICHSTY
jgi:hypothetical protein